MSNQIKNDSINENQADDVNLIKIKPKNIPKVSFFFFKILVRKNFWMLFFMPNFIHVLSGWVDDKLQVLFFFFFFKQNFFFFSI